MILVRVLIATLVLFGGSVFGAEPDKDHWAWKQPLRPKQPDIKDIHSAIDSFILAKLQPLGLSFSSPTNREQLLRRVSFDLIGLPPTPAEIDSFVNDQAPDAYEKVLDRLLASKHYGERWGRHWLDLARYADTNGFEHDEMRPNAWRYRDYVIRSFNADKPFDRFIIEQIAGEEAFPNEIDARIATGFNLLGPDMTDSADQAQRRQNTLSDMTDTAGLVFLGMTIGCARCHDHKYEPVSQIDYYAFQAFFGGADFRYQIDVSTDRDKQSLQTARLQYEKLTKPIRDQIRQIEQPIRDKLFEAKLAKLSPEAQKAHRTPADKRDGGQIELVDQTTKQIAISDAEIEKQLVSTEQSKLKELKIQLKSFDSKRPQAAPVAMGIADKPGDSAKTYLLERGDITNKAQEVKPDFLSVLRKKNNQVQLKNTADGKRLVLAKWIANRDNPLTARVIVNRLWQQHFGRGIVSTSSDFGLRGERPTHPELLDWLAIELIENGWQLKKMHKLMLMSKAYQQSTNGTREAVEKDPENKFLSRMNRIRLDGESVRDSLLAISGRLNQKMGGPGVFPPVPPEVVTGSKGGWPVSKDPQDHVRRSVYIFARRNLKYPFLEAFDQPDSNLSCPKRERSTTAPQALAMFNSLESIESAKALASRITKECSVEKEQIELAYRLVLGRRPLSKESENASRFLKDSPMSEFCRALLNLNEFLYLD